MDIRISRAAVALALCFGAFAPALAQAQGSDELWDVTTEMSVPGMPAGFPMPMMRYRVCNAPGTPPVPDQFGTCEIYDAKRNAQGFEWKQRCDGKPSSGEMRFEGRDSYQGTTTTISGSRTIPTKLSGHRVGTCDAAETKQKLAALREQAAQRRVANEQAAAARSVSARQDEAAMVRAARCAAEAHQLNVKAASGETELKCEPKYKEDLCRRLRTHEGFLQGTRDSTIAEASRFCGVATGTLQASLCQTADAQGELEFLGEVCPSADREKVAQRECAGRKYTSQVAEKYQYFCREAALENLRRGPAQTRKP